VSQQTVGAVDKLKAIQRRLADELEQARIAKEQREAEIRAKNEKLFAPLAKAIRELRQAGYRWNGAELPEPIDGQVKFLPGTLQSLLVGITAAAECEQPKPFVLNTTAGMKCQRFTTADELIEALLEELAPKIMC
jgi:hypothetical protein